MISSASLVRAPRSLDRDPAGVELGRDLPADADTQVVAAARRHVEGGSELGEQRRRIQRREHDRAHQLDGRGRPGGDGQRDERVAGGHVERDVLSGAGVVEAGRLELLRFTGRRGGRLQRRADLHQPSTPRARASAARSSAFHRRERSERDTKLFEPWKAPG